MRRTVRFGAVGLAVALLRIHPKKIRDAWAVHGHDCLSQCFQ